MKKRVLIVLVVVFSSFSGVVQYGDEITPTHLDAKLVNNLLIGLINQKRIAKGLDTLEVNESLNTVCRRIQSKLEFRSFQHPDKIERKINKDLYKATRSEGFDGGLVLPVACQYNGINYKAGKAFYFDKKDESTEFQLFYGEKPRKKDLDQEVKSIDLYDYNQFAEDFLANISSSNQKYLYSKSYKWIGVQTMWYYKSIHKKKIPQIKVVFILGGFQTAGMWDEE